MYLNVAHNMDILMNLIGKNSTNTKYKTQINEKEKQNTSIKKYFIKVMFK